MALTAYHITTTETLVNQSIQAGDNLANTRVLLSKRLTELRNLKAQDQYQINQELMLEIADIHKTYKKTVDVYESLVDLKEKTKKTDKLDSAFATILSQLSIRNYASAESTLNKLITDIKTEQDKLATSLAIPANVVASNNPPGSGYSRQRVDNEIGSFLVDIIAADLSSTRVIVDTASSETCHDNCPVDSLAGFAARSGAYAAINGPYFCPASYPSCVGKANSFDTLLMNKNKVYFNSDNNIYSNVPAVIFSDSSARFVGRSLEWGRDASVDSVIASQPLLLS